MKKLKTFLRKNLNPLYRLVQKPYYLLRHLLERHLLGSRLQEKSWSKRPLGPDYTTTTKHPHRQLLINAINQENPFKKLLEIGSGSGPNLQLLAKKFPRAHFIGVDINKEAIKKGQSWANKEGLINIELQVGQAGQLSQFSNKYFDIVVTDATLLYIGPDKIKKVLNEALRLAKKRVFLIELYQETKKLSRYKNGHWIHNFPQIIKTIDPNAEVSTTKIPPDLWGEPWETFGHLISIKPKQ
jgi:protein-L-isoaspartate O-methyltransferase